MIDPQMNRIASRGTIELATPAHCAQEPDVNG